MWIQSPGATIRHQAEGIAALRSEIIRLQTDEIAALRIEITRLQTALNEAEQLVLFSHDLVLDYRRILCSRLTQAEVRPPNPSQGPRQS